jgi:predicted nucleic acid-binding protein
MQEEIINNMIFLDSCILIDYINGKLSLYHNSYNHYCINSIVEMELIAGARNKRDLNTINKKISIFNNVDIDQDILNLARALMFKYNLSQNMSIYDSIIASTCMIYNLELYTHNKKDFRFICDLNLK